MVNLGGQPQVLLQDYYQRVLNEIVDEYRIQRVESPGHVVPANAGWVEVVQHIERFVGGSGDSMPHYRYRRYSEVIGDLTPGQGREALVDLGCGCGLFSWVFLDWATRQGVGYDRLDLYGFDHSPAMLRLALEARQRLLLYAPNFPVFHCSGDVDGLCDQLAEHHEVNTEYTIALGHVLVQAHTPDAIRNFTRVIAYVMGLIEPGSNCVLVAVDADRRRATFAEGWAALLGNLETLNIVHEEAPVGSTAINDSGRAKRASLTLAR